MTKNLQISPNSPTLFGSGDEPTTDDYRFNGIDTSGDELLTDRTDSTMTPSPKGTSLGGGAPSERSEPVTEDSLALDGDSSRAPAAGLRLLQQRRREREGEPPQETTVAEQPRDESEELLKLWMKQRW